MTSLDHSLLTPQPIPVRRHPRAPIDIAVAEVEGEQAYELRSRDISIGGIYLDAVHGLCAEHSPSVSIEFTLPGDFEPVWAYGQVVRDDRYGEIDGHALRFEEMADADRRRIERYVTQYYRPLAAPAESETAIAHPVEAALFRLRAVSELLG